MLKWIPTYRRWFLRPTTTYQLWLLALLSLLPDCQESTTMLVYYLDWRKIRCFGTNEIIFLIMLFLYFGCLVDVTCKLYSWASVNARLSLFWFKFSRPFVYTLLTYIYKSHSATSVCSRQTLAYFSPGGGGFNAWMQNKHPHLLPDALWKRDDRLCCGFAGLTLSLRPGYHLKTTSNNVKFEIPLHFLFLFCISMWNDFPQHARYWKWFVIRPENIVFAGVCVQFFQPGNFADWGSDGLRR